MRMTTRVTLMILAGLIMLSGIASADDAEHFIAQPSDSTQLSVMPAAIQHYLQSAQGTIDIRNITENFTNDASRVTYNNKGLIDNIVLSDGTPVTYSYGYDQSGSLSSITLSVKDVRLLSFVAKDEKNQPGTNPPTAVTQNNNPQDGDMHTMGFGTGPGPGPDKSVKKQKPPEPAITIIVPQDALPQIARKPIDLDKIKDGLDRALKDKNKAYDEYMKNTAPYYEKILNELAAAADGLRAEGVKADISAKNNNPRGFVDGRQRKNIDEVVQEIRKTAEEGRGRAPQAERFIAVERILTDEFLSPNMQIFEDKVRQAMDYVDGIIDSIIKSKLALYLNINKEKIEAIVNLPEAENK